MTHTPTFNHEEHLVKGELSELEFLLSLPREVGETEINSRINAIFDLAISRYQDAKERHYTKLGTKGAFKDTVDELAGTDTTGKEEV